MGDQTTRQEDKEELKAINNAQTVVTEKVHGANFSMHVDPSGIYRFGKRTSYLRIEEDFFRYQEMLKRDLTRISESIA